MEATHKRHPLTWVPSLYFAQGLPFAIVMAMAAIMYKRLGISNAEITFWTGLLGWAWVVKPLWSPFLEMAASPKKIVVGAQILGGASMIACATVLNLPGFFIFSVSILAVTALTSATHDIASDGTYISVLDKETQSIYSGWMSAFWQLGKLFAVGILVYAAGKLEISFGYMDLDKLIIDLNNLRNAHVNNLSTELDNLISALNNLSTSQLNNLSAAHVNSLIADLNNLSSTKLNSLSANQLNSLSVNLNSLSAELDKLTPAQKAAIDASNIAAAKKAWAIISAVPGVILICLGLYHSWSIPFKKTHDVSDTSFASTMKTLGETIIDFFKKPGIWFAILFIVLFRAGEGLVQTIGRLFLVEPISKGGLGMSTEQMGIAYGGWSTVAFIVGGILGGYFAAWLGLKRALFPLILLMNIPNLTFWYLSYALPNPATDMFLISSVLCVEMFGYGFGFTGLMLYIMQVVAPGKYPTSHYALGTGIMALGFQLFSMISGSLEAALGYKTFFIVGVLACIPVLLLALIAKIPDSKEN